MKWIKFFFLVLIALGWVSYADPLFAFAQGESSTVLVTENPENQQGQLLIVAFQDGLPAEGIEIQTQKGLFKTNSSGVLSIVLPAQNNQSIFIPQTGQRIPVQLVAGEETQVIVNLLTDREGGVEVQAPELKDVKNQPTKNKQSVLLKIQSGTQEKISDATLLFSGLDKVFKTDASGQLQAEIPEGIYSVTVFHPNYQTKTLADFKVAAGQDLIQNIELKAAKNELEEVVVLAPKARGSISALVEVRKQSSAVTDVLGAEQMARAGDGDAAASLRRVTGLTLVGGKYVYVRGLGERYSGVQMNSFSLPSPEPARRVVPLDLFPTSIMESIVVQKSYSPDLPGEFGGGLIQLKTRTLPEKFFLRAQLSTAYENIKGRLEHQGGSTDWLGFDDGTRKMPVAIQNALAQGKQLEVNTTGFNNGFSADELTQMGRSLPNNYNFSRTDNPSMPGLSLSAGNGWSLSRWKIGTSASVLYGQNSDQLTRTVRTFNVGADSKLEKDTIRNSEYSEIETRVAGSYDLGFEYAKEQKLSMSTFLLRNTTSLTQIDDTSYVSAPPTQTYTADFTERQLWARHLKGEHELSSLVRFPMQVDWRWGWADAKRDSPDRREISFLNSNGTLSMLDNQSGNRRIYSNLTDDSQEQAVNVVLPFKKEGEDFVKIKLGLLRLEKSRRSDINRLYFSKGSGITNEDLVGDGQSVLAPGKINPDGFVIKNITNDADSYSGQQTIDAQYAMIDVSPWSSWSLQAGARQESSEQLVNTFKYFDEANPSSFSVIRMRDLLPSYGIVWKPTEKIRARLTYSETLARPDFREMSTVGFVDDETGNIVQGNARLKGTVIKNIDQRWEYYFTSDEYASLGFFYKEFESPIETLFLPGVNRIQTFDNAKAAQNFGVEFEGRIGLRHFSRPLRRWTILSNLTYIESNIELNEQNRGTQTSTERPLQGQSPYVVNLQMQYDRPQWGLSTTLLYNVVGKRITEVGTNGIPDTYEQPFGQLDFVATQRIKDHWTISLRARNLLNPDVKSTQGDEVVRSQRRGRILGLTLGAVF